MLDRRPAPLTRVAAEKRHGSLGFPSSLSIVMLIASAARQRRSWGPHVVKQAYTMSGETVQNPAASDHGNRLVLLDGWRALSIIAVLAGHWLPLGPARWQLNEALAAIGMALFFTLSGFLITRLLLRDPHVGRFLIRRIFRIVPLAWLAMVILAVVHQADFGTVAANLLFTANLPPARLMEGGQHLWSLCVEMHFYLGVAVLVALAGRKAVYLVPVLAALVTAGRIAAGETISIVTWFRVDEILAGATLALLLVRIDRPLPLPRWTCLAMLVALLASAHPDAGPLAYLRPYFAAMAVGSSLFAAPALLTKVWTSRPARYVAETSYAIYVVHGMLTATWLGGADASKIEKYALRPLLLAATMLLAHLSTFYYEKRWIALGRRLAQSPGARTPQSIARAT